MQLTCKVLFLVVLTTLLTWMNDNGWAASEPHALNDKPIPTFQKELLDLAFATSTAIPIRPHIKDRSRTQEAVVSASLTLDQPQRAKRYLEQIDNWRRGAAYADLARYVARNGQTTEAQHYLALAAQMAADPGVEAWRRDRIRVNIAKAYTWLGQAQHAKRFQVGVDASEVGKVAQAEASLSTHEDFQPQISHLNTLIRSGNFDLIKNALTAYAQLFDRFYTDATRRPQVEQKIKASLGKLPVSFQLELLMSLADYALKHADPERALEQINTAQTLLNRHQWPPQFGIPLTARLAARRAQAGDRQNARRDADAALAWFNTDRAKIVDIYRAETLRPLAETYQMMGDTVAALALYKRAVEEGVQNPNSRPHAEDLSATCRSMALHGVAPDATLWARMRQIRDGLGHPW